jgi:uncharacterized protein YjbJ (UPF0337 family)
VKTPTANGANVELRPAAAERRGMPTQPLRRDDLEPALRRSTKGGRNAMGIADKISHKAEELSGKAKETVGRMTGNEDLEAQGRADQAEADVQQAGDKMRDAKDDASEGLQDAKDDLSSAARDAKERVSEAADHLKPGNA